MPYKLNPIFKSYEQISIRYSPEQDALWCYMKPHPRPCFTPTLLSELKQLQQTIFDSFESSEFTDLYPINYMILASHVPGTFNLGGDLNLFAEHILNKDRDQLLHYATACIDILYNNAVNMHLPLTTISLVEGSALGGGFEAALSSNILIAERSAELGLPEILFNLFPGMGAYSLLARRIGIVEAERIITSGKVYRADELYEMGVVDVLAEDGEGKQTVNQYIKQHSRSSNGLRAINAARQRFSPITYEELLDITKIWVDAALNLTKRELRIMKLLVSAQDRRLNKTLTDSGRNRVLRTKQDRRIFNAVKLPFIDQQGNIIEHDRRKASDRRTDPEAENKQEDMDPQTS